MWKKDESWMVNKRENKDEKRVGWVRTWWKEPLVGILYWQKTKWKDSKLWLSWLQIRTNFSREWGWQDGRIRSSGPSFPLPQTHTDSATIYGQIIFVRSQKLIESLLYIGWTWKYSPKLVGRFRTPPHQNLYPWCTTIQTGEGLLALSMTNF